MPGAVRVGVKRWNADQPAEPDGEANGQVGPMWVEIDGIRIPGDVLVQASHEFTESEGGPPGFGVTTLKIITSSYETVDHQS